MKSRFQKYATWLGMLLTMSLLASCSTTPNITKSIRYIGKSVNEVFAKEGYPDESVHCVKDNVVRNIYVYRRPIFEKKAYVSDVIMGQDGPEEQWQTYTAYSHTKYSYVFADMEDKVTSIRDFSGLGNLEKEFGCNQYQQELKVPTAEELAQRKVQPRVWKAIAMNEKDINTIYISREYKTENEAVADAMKKCERASGSKCEVWQRFSNMCLATATGIKNGKLTYFPGIAPKESFAEYASVVSCEQNGGTQCRPFKSAVCAVPCNMMPGDRGSDKCFYDLPMLGSYGVNGGKVMPVEFTKIPDKSSN